MSQGGGHVPFWSPDGNTLYYLTFGPTARTFTAARLERDPVLVVLSRDSLFTGRYAAFTGSGLHPDGDRWIVAEDVGSADSDASAIMPARLVMVTNFFTELRERMGGN